MEVRCSECQSWSKDFMLGYLKHKKSLVSKGKKSSSSSVLMAVVTTAPVVSPPTLPVGTDDQLRSYVHSLLAEFLSVRSARY